MVCLLCGVLTATLAQDLHRNTKPAARRYQVQESKAIPQERQTFREPVAWKYPEPPAERELKYDPNFELKVPTPASSVTAICGESGIRVEAKRDLLGIGRPVQDADVTLGGCAATGVDPENQVLIFESGLQDCGSHLMMNDDSFVYSFTLLYIPSPLGDSPIVRTGEVTVNIQCHYQRKHDVSSGLLTPTWTPLSDNKASEESLHFSLELMTDDWQSSRSSSQFLLGDMMKFKATVKQFHHAPLRVTVDSCVATVVPIVDTVPRYNFLGNKGCLFDSQLTDSTSQFLPRSADDNLHFEVEAFKFQQDHSGVLYITCSLRAVGADTAVDHSNKACSFFGGWREASGRHNACACCDTTCLGSPNTELSGSGVWEEESTVGPITVKERPLW